MSYDENFFLFESSVSNKETFGNLNKLSINESIVRNNKGEVMFRFKDEVVHNHLLYYVLFQGSEENKKTFDGFVKDAIISKRILEYMDTHFVSTITNCSSFAHYLTTGEFISCHCSDSNLVLPNPMVRYAGQEIEVGDMICVLYSSRFHNFFRRIHARKNRHRCIREDHILVIGEEDSQKSFSALDVKKMFWEAKLDGYHFLVCVDTKNGEPVFIQQLGINYPQHEPVAPIVFSCGGYDPYMNHKTPPFVTLIQKRKSDV